MKTYKLAERDYKKGLKYREIAEKYEVSLSTVKSWKLRYKWTRDGDVEDLETECIQESVQEKLTAYTKEHGAIKENANRKVKKEMARTLIEDGATITEVSEQLGIPRSTIGRWSSEEKMQAKQLEYLKEFRDQYKDRVRANKLKRLELNEKALEKVKSDIHDDSVNKSTFEKIKLSEEIEQSVIELDRIERYERLELEKKKVGDIDLTNVDSIVELLKKLPQEKLEEIISKL